MEIIIIEYEKEYNLLRFLNIFKQNNTSKAKNV